MTKYKVKNISCKNSTVIQYSIKAWIESRKHINVVSTNIWCDEDMSYATIIYTEKDYNL
jgi:hypothetical protein